MADAPKYRWQQSRGEALYVDDATDRILGYIGWENENRLKIDAHGISSKGAKEFAPLGMFATEQAAKAAVEENVAKVFPVPVELVDNSVRAMAAGLTEGLEKGVVKK
jgi:hypothetical protein